MLSVARALGAPTGGYVERDHPAQAEVRRVIELVIDAPLDIDLCGRDGCSIPTWAAPLSAFARGFARMATGNLPAPLPSAAARLFDAATSNPLLVAGTGHFDTLAMAAFGGRVMQKGGAEGVQCGAIRDRGWGYALKIDDGNMQASVTLAAELLATLAGASEAELAVLAPFRTPVIRNVRNFEVGSMRVTAEMRAAVGAG
jgi:L-asparaginase II